MLAALRYFSQLLFLFSISLQVLADNGRNDYDVDDDGLIEINDLADLDEIRNNLNGATLYGENIGCPTAGCNGFELTANLDFDTNQDGQLNELDSYWNGGKGWKPIGQRQDNKRTGAFIANFSGNGHIISNLYVNRSTTDWVGLFGSVNQSVDLPKKSITDLVISGSLTQIVADRGVGILAGEINGYEIKNIHVTGKITCDEVCGGLSGFLLYSTVENIYSEVDLTGRILVGSVIGSSTQSSIKNVLSLGSTQNDDEFPPLNGIIGYASSGADNTIESSYWLIDSRSEPNKGDESDSYFGLSIEELSCPTSPNNTDCTLSSRKIFEKWDPDFWHFSDAGGVPAIKLGDQYYKPNDAPIVNLQLSQNGAPEVTIVADHGNVSILASITDENVTDQHTIVWAINNTPDGLSIGNPLVFPSDDLAAGTFTISATVTDSGLPPLTATDAISVRVISDKRSSGGAIYWLLALLVLSFAGGRRPEVAARA